MAYCIYLRKSRADIELEEKGEGETLARHRKILEDFAKKHNYEIGKIYSEIVSGESIALRPEMQNLLYDLEHGFWQGVLVMEIERLARGDTIDQGIIAKVFRESSTKIITPNKIYDVENEFDEEYFEFSLFMSRREYKTINRRIQRGRIASVKEGKYISPTPPFGFDRKKSPDGKGYILCKNPHEAPIVLSIYEQFLNGHSVSEICDKLNLCSVKPRKSNTWSCSSIRDILKNPANAGFIRWARRKNIKVKDGNNTKISRKNCDNYILTQGLHDGIISQEDYKLTLDLLQKHRTNTTRSDRTLKNSLSGLIFCKNCGKPLSRSAKSNGDLLICKSKGCPTVSEKLSRVENALICELERYYKDVYISLETTNYSDKKRKQTEPDYNTEFSDKKTGIFELYKSLENIESKNKLLRSIIEKITYHKNQVQGKVELEVAVRI